MLEGLADLEASFDELAEVAAVEESWSVRGGVVQFVASGVCGLVDPVGAHRSHGHVERCLLTGGREERFVGFGASGQWHVQVAENGRPLGEQQAAFDGSALAAHPGAGVGEIDVLGHVLPRQRHRPVLPGRRDGSGAGLLHRQQVRGTAIDRNTEICSHNSSCLLKRDFVTPTPTTGVEPTPHGKKRHNFSVGIQSGKRPGRSKESLTNGPQWCSTVGYRCDMARNADALPVEPVIDLVDDGLSDSEIATRFAEWLSDLDAVPVVVLPVSAIDELRDAYADDDV